MPSSPKPDHPKAYRQRQDGWTPERVQLFLACLGHTGCVRDACRVADISSTSAYRHRRRFPDFAAAWEKALDRSQQGLVAVAYKRAIEGRETVIMRKGVEVERRIAPSDAMLALLLKRGDMSGGAGGHADLAHIPREEIITLAEWRDERIRFDCWGERYAERDPEEVSKEQEERFEQLYAGLRAQAARGDGCPYCQQALPPDFPNQSLAAMMVLGAFPPAALFSGPQAAPD